MRKRRISSRQNEALFGHASFDKQEKRMNLLNLPIGEKAPEIVNAVVEVPFGCTNKYEYDAKRECSGWIDHCSPPSITPPNTLLSRKPQAKMVIRSTS